MNNLMERIKVYFSSIFGKLGGIIAGLAFFITLILSVLYKNRIDISLLKAIFSGIITIIIVFIIGAVLKKYLGDIINESENNNNNADIDYGAIDDHTYGNIEDGNNNSIDNDKSDINISDMNNTINIDSNMKSNKYTPSNDIGDIVFGSKNTSSPSYSAAGSIFPERKAANEEILKEVNEDPEKVAKAVRTMIAKDEKEDK